MAHIKRKLNKHAIFTTLIIFLDSLFQHFIVFVHDNFASEYLLCIDALVNSFNSSDHLMGNLSILQRSTRHCEDTDWNYT